jgi:hypothetical protein
MSLCPPGEIGARLKRVNDFTKGEFVHVRMQVVRAEPSDRDSFALRLLMPIASSPFAEACHILWVARSQIVCRAPPFIVR